MVKKEMMQGKESRAFFNPKYRKEAEALYDQYLEEMHVRMEEERLKNAVLTAIPERIKDASCAAELQAKGISCSMIYGALPYETRRAETERFAKGETSVVVATDAIGMGLNLPVKRVVFLETEKFDGYGRRDLLPEEIQQISVSDTVCPSGFSADAHRGGR